VGGDAALRPCGSPRFYGAIPPHPPLEFTSPIRLVPQVLQSVLNVVQANAVPSSRLPTCSRPLRSNPYACQIVAAL
jgi:hypothetical protein